MGYDDIIKLNPYELGKKEKEKLLTERLLSLTETHKIKCREYSRILDALSFDAKKVNSYTDLPFLPVRLFKDMTLKSVGDEEVVKQMTSSGTTGQKVSRIFLDRTTSANQQKTMVKIVSSFTGSERMPMIIIDCPSVIKDRNMFSARGAGILGFSIFGSKKIYALDDEMHLDIDGLQDFLKKYSDKKILLFGFTFMIWKYFYQELLRLKENGITLDLSNAIMIHGGGWKKLASEAVSEQVFHDKLREVCGLSDIHDYYGMVEQTGCIYMECECGHLHSSIYSDVITRNPKDYSECKIGEKGIVQVVSTIPESYPGHSLLTEDEGIILGEDDCPCGRKGKYFKIIGRVKEAEIRGCSDTFSSDITDDGQKINFLIGDMDRLKNIEKVSPKEPFCKEILGFVDSVSSKLLSDKDAKIYPDVVTLGFWLRRASVWKLMERYSDRLANHMGRGTVFHIAPSNVTVNYAYSLFTSLLCGNANIVRVPSKAFPEVDVINKSISAALDEHPNIKDYIVLLRYDRNKEINDFISGKADVRVIWGGDKTIEEIQKSPLKIGAGEVLFGDRYSLAIIDTDYYMDRVNAEDGKNQAKRIAIDFYNDTYMSDQNACTSPRVVVWTGTRRNEAEVLFWNELKDIVNSKYNYRPIQGVNKYTSICEAAALYESEIKAVNMEDNTLVRAKVSALSPKLMDFRGNSGLFYEYVTDDISLLYDFCNDTHCQTVCVIGDKSILNPLISRDPKGIYRTAAVGHTMDFDFIWDGYDLFNELTAAI